jgi:exonuclease 3'-5' domain-containing protein 1
MSALAGAFHVAAALQAACGESSSPREERASRSCAGGARRRSPSPSFVGGFALGTAERRSRSLSLPAAASSRVEAAVDDARRSVRAARVAAAATAIMGKKARLACVACGASYKRKTLRIGVHHANAVVWGPVSSAVVGGDANHQNRFCGTTCAAAAAASGPSSAYGDIPPASFADADAPGVYATGGGGSAAGGSYAWERETGGGVKGSPGKRKKKKKGKKKAASDSGDLAARPVEECPRCLAVLNILDDTCDVISSPGEALDRAVRAIANAPGKVIAVDCEGVAMSRIGRVTLVQIAVPNERVYLFDVQALGSEACFERGGGGGGGEEKDENNATNRSVTLKSVLEDASITKLMFDCRVDSDALYHQHGIALNGVFDIQLADVAARRAASQSVALLSGVPKCAARHLGKGAAAEANALAAFDGVVDAAAGPDAAAISRVSEHLKSKVKASFAPDLGGDGTLWARRPLSADVRRYAALDAWLLVRIHDAMVRLLPIRPRSRGARRSLRTFPVVTLHPRFPFNV